jgi:hypothetical protein
MNKLKYSLVTPAIRSHLYKRFYNSISQSSITDFEIVFVGDVPPIEPMPDNFRYIFTEVANWNQCMEIAARYAQGEYLVMTADDEMFSPGFLDTVEDYTHRLDMDNTLISFRFQLNGTFCDDALVFDKHILNSPVVGVGGVFKKETWHSLGGLDRRFPGAMSDLDMVYRFYEKGYRLFLTPNCWLNETGSEVYPSCIQTMLPRTGQAGVKLLRRLWFKEDYAVQTRRDILWSFSDHNILTEDQCEINYGPEFIAPKVDITVETILNRYNGIKVHLKECSRDCLYLVEISSYSTYNILQLLHLSLGQSISYFPEDPFMKKVMVRVRSPEDDIVFQKVVVL